jgi:hypothetical protein
MKNNKETDYLFNALVILLLMNCIWVSIATVINGVVSSEGIVSSLRLLVSVLLAYAIHRHVTLSGISLGLFWVATINSMLCSIQLFDALFDQAYLPAWLRYGWLYGVEDLELWRKGGLVPGFQTSSLLAVYGIFFGAWRGRRNIMIVLLPFFVVAVLIGARTFVPVALVGLLYVLIRMPAIAALWLSVIAWSLLNLDGFREFFQFRFGGLLEVFLSFDFAADYSAEDTISSYREFSLLEFFVGNSEARYSDAGGKDPFYTRWFYQAGALSMLLLLAVQAVIAMYCGRYSAVAYLVFAIALYHNIKGELFTSIGTFDFLVLIAFVFLRDRGRRSVSWALCTIGDGRFLSVKTHHQLQCLNRNNHF